MTSRLGGRALRCLAIAFAAALLAAQAALPARADGEGRVAVQVRDVTTGEALTAQMVLRGPLIAADVSDATGSVTFVGVPEGVYTIVARARNYKKATSEPFEVVAGKTVSVRVDLAKETALKAIGSVTVRAPKDALAASVDEHSVLRRLAPSLTDALGALPGLQLDHDDTPGAGPTLSIDGHPASQTAVSLDGIPMNLPGSAANFGLIDTDLFRGASVSARPANGASGGAIAFRTIEPTLAWQGASSMQFGRYDRRALSASEQGTAGAFGFAATVAARSNPSPLDGLLYEDASGLTYVHRGDDRTAGLVTKLRAPVGASVLSATYLTSWRTSDLICAQISGVLPCGYGPGNSASSSYRLAALSDLGSIGTSSYRVTAFSIATRTEVNLFDRVSDLVPAPLRQTTVGRAAGVTGSLQFAPHGPHTIAAQFATETLVTGGALETASAAAPPYSARSTFSSFDVSDRVRLGATTTATVRLGRTFSSDAGSAPQAGLALTWRRTPTETFTASADAGSAIYQDGRLGFTSDPSSLGINCAAHTATGYSPGDAPAHNSFTSLRAGWQREFARGSVAVQAFAQTDRGVTYTGLIGASALPPALFPPQYLAALAARAPSVCGQPAASSWSARDLYFYVPVAGPTIAYRGVHLTARRNLSPGFEVAPSLDYLRATLSSSDPRLTDPFTLTVPNRQLLGVPVWRAGLLLSYQPPRARGIEALANVRYVGANNSAGLPAYTIVDLGIARTLRHGSVSLVVNNALQAFSGRFTSPLNAVPLFTGGGTSVVGLARPNSPRLVMLNYSVALGRNAAPVATLAESMGVRAPGASMVPGYLITALPASPPHDAFERNTGTACTPELRKTSDALVTVFQPFVTALDASKTPAGYPPVGGAAPPDLTGTTFVYHPAESTYSVSITSARIDLLQALSSCLHIHVGSLAEGNAKSLYVSSSTSLVDASLYFSPAVGFYSITVPRPGAGQRVRTFALPATAPLHPFRLQSVEVCGDELRPIAVRLLGELETYFAAPAPPGGTTPGWTIVRSATAGEASYELRSNDLGAVLALYSCGYVAGATTSELGPRGYHGVAAPAFNFAPALGLYVVAPEPPAAAKPKS